MMLFHDITLLLIKEGGGALRLLEAWRAQYKEVYVGGAPT